MNNKIIKRKQKEEKWKCFEIDEGPLNVIHGQN